MNHLNKENWTREHVIPNSIGGRMKIGGFICKKCNSEKGDTWDAALAVQFRWISLMVGITREANRTPLPSMIVTTVSGKKYSLQNDCSYRPEKFIFSKVDEGSQLRLSFTARTREEAVKKINELATTYPKFNKEEALQQAIFQTEYLNEPIKMELSFGGELAGRSIVKTALAYAFTKEIPISACENVRDYLSWSPKINEADNPIPSSNDCYGLAYQSDYVLQRKPDAIFHCVALYSDESSKRLLAYVEYFGLARWLVVLSKNYEGPNINVSYALDPTTGSNVDITLNWGPALTELAKITDGYGTDNYQAVINKMIPAILARANSRGLENAKVTAKKNVLDMHNLKEGDIISGSISNEIKKAVEEAVDVYERHSRKGHS